MTATLHELRLKRLKGSAELSEKAQARIAKYHDLLSAIGPKANMVLLSTYLDDNVIRDPWSRERAERTLVCLARQGGR